MVGLGNPGPKYQNTRHNAGFMAVAHFANKRGLEDPRRNGNSLLTWGKVEGQKVLLAWPQRFMNNSGEEVKKIVDFYKVAPENLLVVYDEMDLPVGRIKVSKGGGAAGHRGVESLVEALPNTFDRLRFGVGRPPKNNFGHSNIDYVLGPFNSLESEAVDKALDWSADIIRIWLIKNLAGAQMLANRNEPRPTKKTKPLTEGEEPTEADSEAPKGAQEGKTLEAAPANSKTLAARTEVDGFGGFSLSSNPLSD
ncbi:MAG: aminoacyl-tRNA hydrolase [Deltaproteobacteria bacterium]|nr:aminoacyl-tRNA hydrolase [Deltaproteobacteria bacterium]